MKKVICSYGDKSYFKSLNLLEKTSYEIGMIDKFYKYDREWLEKTEFYRKNKYILDKERGNGVWCWKPYIILKTFEDIDDGDIVLYSDAGIKVIDILNNLFKVAEHHSNDGIILFKLPAIGVPSHALKTWTKRDCFILTNSDEEKYWGGNMSNGALSLWVKNKYTTDFLKEWQRYLRDPRIVTDDINMCGKPNFLEFRSHRHDQSVLSILAIKYEFEIFRDPTQWGNSEIDKFNNSPYPQLFHHHRNFKH